MKTQMTCVACPIGCQLTVEHTKDEIISITGNSCKRGITYAQTEIKSPTRTLTSTVKVKDGFLPVVPVKSDKPIPKSLLLNCMKVINSTELKSPVKIGDIIISDILGTGVNIIATNDNPGIS